ncbi:MAG: hypothetical protein HYZ91_01615 [Candidatus Omnitrophica bacterium]|nr:hypothetical protein [Candidatus Omnitrophota bacterium]
MRRTFTPPFRAGFTLVETLIVGSLLMSISVVLAVWLTGVSDLWWTSSTFSHSQTSVQLAVSRVVAELRSATSSGVSSPPNILIAAGNASMTFYLPAAGVVDANGNLVWDVANPIQYVYVPAQQQLQRLQGGQTVVLATQVTAIRFDDITTDVSLSANELRVQLTQQMTTPGGRTLPAVTVNEIVRLRN